VFHKLKTLSLDLIVYGMGDVAVQVVGFLLLPLFTRILKPADYGVLALLITVELIAKIVFRFGIDASFMRLYYDCHDERSRQRLASTIFLFLLAVNGAVLLLLLAGAPFLAFHLFGGPGHGLLLGIVLVNTFIGGFFFIPFHVLRIEGRSLQFSALTFSRAASTTVLRVLFIAVVHMGVLGFVLADIVVTLALALALLPRFARLIRPVFSVAVLQDALRFGVPRVPHGVAQQVIGPGTDPALLRVFLPIADSHAREEKIGVYNIGATFGATLKLFLSAFEYAWAPFYFATMREPDAKRTFSRVTTYGFAVLVLMTAGLSAVALDLIRGATVPGYFGAARVVPWIAIGVTFQGIYLLTSIGLNITKHTGYYPVATGVAAAVNILSNAVLIPRYGILGPAYSIVVSYAVLAVVSLYFSRRFYPVAYEWGRLGRVVLAGVAGYLLATTLFPARMFAPLGVLVRGSIVVAAYCSCLAVTGFFRPRELVRLRMLVRQLRSVRAAKKKVEEEEDAAAMAATASGADDELGR
jgi:O-antigen/teichoic acid export membrane protein